MQTSQKPSLREALTSLALLGAALGLAYAVSTYIGIDALRAAVASAGWYAVVLVVILKATTIVVAPLGGTIIYPIAGAAYGFFPGLGLTLLGDALGSTIAFFLSRRFGRSILRFFTSASQAPTIDAVLIELSDKRRFARARVYFAGFMDLFAYAAGLTRIPYLYFIAVHSAVHAPIAALYVLFGEVIVSGAWWLTLPLGIGMSLLAIYGATRLSIGVKGGQ
ncbi:VTT domain-containing protein [Patescibacteria group bacterium]|nr:VTT domain-containing protein [Patescibacteria group bacterium]